MKPENSLRAACIILFKVLNYNKFRKIGAAFHYSFLLPITASPAGWTARSAGAAAPRSGGLARPVRGKSIGGVVCAGRRFRSCSPSLRQAEQEHLAMLRAAIDLAPEAQRPPTMISTCLACAPDSPVVKLRYAAGRWAESTSLRQIGARAKPRPVRATRSTLSINLHLDGIALWAIIL